MKLRIPLFIKIMTPLVALTLLTLAASGILIYREGARKREDELAGQLENVAVAAASRVDSLMLQAIQAPADDSTPEYEAVKSKLLEARDIGGADWVGIYRRDGDKLSYWVDTDATGVRYPFFYATPEHRAAFDTPQGKPFRVHYSDEFGAYLGYDAPVVITGTTGTPQVVGLVEAVVYKEKLMLLQRETLQQVGIILACGSIAAVLLALLATIVTFNRPMRRLKRGAMTLATGEFGYTIDLQSNDELGDLADTFNQMSGQLKAHYDEVQQRNTELKMVYQIAQAITASSSDPDATFHTILERVDQMIPFEEGEICSYVPEEDALRVRGWRGQKGSVNWRERKYPLGQGFTGRVGQTRRSFLSPDITQEPGTRPIYDKVVENPVRSYVGVPLLVGDRLVGTMQLVSTQAGQFDEHARQLLETIALQAAVAIDTAQRVEAREHELEQQIAQLRIEVDEVKRARQVAEVTETDYFKQLQHQAKALRNQRSSQTESP